MGNFFCKCDCNIGCGRAIKVNKQKNTECFCLNNFVENDVVCVCEISDKLSEGVLRRLLELGFVVNAKVRVEKFSFLKEVVIVEINGYLISLRSDISKHILCKRMG